MACPIWAIRRNSRSRHKWSAASARRPCATSACTIRLSIRRGGHRVSQRPRQPPGVQQPGRAPGVRVFPGQGSHAQRVRPAGRLHRREYRDDRDRAERIGTGCGAGARNRARDAAPHGAHGQQGRTAVDGNAGGTGAGDRRAQLAGGIGRGDHRAGGRNHRADRLHARIRARSRPYRLPDPGEIRFRCARDAGVFPAHAKGGTPVRKQRPDLSAQPPGYHRAHRRRREPGSGPAVQAGPRQPRLPAGARQAARRTGRAARYAGAARSGPARQEIQQRNCGALWCGRGLVARARSRLAPRRNSRRC